MILTYLAYRAKQNKYKAIVKEDPIEKLITELKAKNKFLKSIKIRFFNLFY